MTQAFYFRQGQGGIKYGNAIHDSYGRLRVDRNTREYYRPIIEELFPYKKFILGGGYTETFWGRIPTFKEMLEDSENTQVVLEIRVFEDVMEKDRENFLTGILELVRLLEGQNLYRSTISIYIYDEEPFKDIDIEWFMEVSGGMTHNLQLDDNHEGMETDLHYYRMKLNRVIQIRQDRFKEIQTI